MDEEADFRSPDDSPSMCAKNLGKFFCLREKVILEKKLNFNAIDPFLHEPCADGREDFYT